MNETAFVSVFLLFAISGGFAAFFIVSELAIRAWVHWHYARLEARDERIHFFMKDQS